MYETKLGVGGSGTSTVIKPAPKPNSKDFYISGVSIEPAENGYIVECRHRLKPEVEAKIKKTTGKDYIDYDMRNPTSKYVAKDMDEAGEFIVAKLTGKDYGSPSTDEPKTKVKLL